MGQGTVAFGDAMTDIIAQIVFWLFVALGTIYIVIWIGKKIYNQCRKTNPVEQKLDTIDTKLQQLIDRLDKTNDQQTPQP